MIYGLAAGMAFMLVEVIRFVRAERKHAALKKRQEEKRLLFMERYSGGLNDEWKRTGEGTVRHPENG
jgi:hypothetical protein